MFSQTRFDRYYGHLQGDEGDIITKIQRYKRGNCVAVILQQLKI